MKLKELINQIDDNVNININNKSYNRSNMGEILEYDIISIDVEINLDKEHKKSSMEYSFEMGV